MLREGVVTTTACQTVDLNDTHTGDDVEVIDETIEWIEDPSNLKSVSTSYTVTWSYDSANGEDSD